MYESFKASVLGKVIGDGQCVSLVVNNSNAYIEHLFPGVSWPNIMPPVASAYQLAGKGNSYLEWIENDHADVNQLPEQGDIMVFGPTGPNLPYVDKYANPDGHCGICDSATPTGYELLQQNAPAFGAAANVTEYAWDFRPCLGWYHPTISAPAPAPTTPAPEGQTITLPATTGPWHAYPVGGPYNPNTPGLPELWPSKFGGLTYTIDANRGNGIYTITTQDFGQRDLWTNGSNVTIS
jgi:hypothetical protein